VRQPRTWLYLDPNIEQEFQSAVEAKSVDSGENLVVLIPDDGGVFYRLEAGSNRLEPLVVDGKVYIGDEDGDVAIFRHSADPNVAMKDEGGSRVPYYGVINMGNSVYSTPVLAGNLLYIANKSHLFAIENQSEPKE
jgi:hypothetical protein